MIRADSSLIQAQSVTNSLSLFSLGRLIDKGWTEYDKFNERHLNREMVE